MNIAKLQEQILRHEGISLKPYTDTVGKLTIGVGHNLTDKGLTRPQVMSILRDDINDVVAFTVRHFPWFHTLDDVRQRAIADLIFDLMGKIFEFTHMLHAIEHGDWDRASAELLNSTFATQVGARAKDLAYMLRTGRDPA